MITGGAMAQTTPVDPLAQDAAQTPLSMEGVQARLGPPHVARQEGMGAMWTYSWPDCALFVFFEAAAPDQPLRFVGASTGPRRRGAAVLPLEACLASRPGASRKVSDASE